VNIHTTADHLIGPDQKPVHHYSLAILCCCRPIYTSSGLWRRLSGRCGHIFRSRMTQDACGASWRASEQWPTLPTRNERGNYWNFFANEHCLRPYLTLTVFLPLLHMYDPYCAGMSQQWWITDYSRSVAYGANLDVQDVKSHTPAVEFTCCCDVSSLENTENKDD